MIYRIVSRSDVSLVCRENIDQNNISDLLDFQNMFQCNSFNIASFKIN